MNRSTLLDEWSALWRRLGAAGDAEPVFFDLEARCSEEGRAYHNLAHIAHCLDELRGYPGDLAQIDAVEYALWFHDAVYDPRAKDNEERSAGLASETARKAGLPEEFANQAARLILATNHVATPDSPEAELLVDIDLSILGQPEAVFNRYEHEIRREYAWVPEGEFARGRSRVLEAFASRPSIYSTPFFRAKYESAARANLARSIIRLSWR